MSNWTSIFGLHLKKLKVREITPEAGDDILHVGNSVSTTRFHGTVEMPYKAQIDPGVGKEYVDKADQEIKDTYLPLSAGDSHVITEGLFLDGPRSINALSGEGGKLQYNGKDRIKWGSNHIWLSKELDMQDHKIINVDSPTDDCDAATKKYVDDNSGGVPVGSIMFWINTDAPLGWFKLQGEKFDKDVYPQLHEYLRPTASYAWGVLPDWSGMYPVEYGDHARSSLGALLEHRTALPTSSPITAKTSKSIPDGRTRGFNGAGGTNAYSDGVSPITVTLAGGDDVTRPPSVVGHYIIKHD